MDIRTYLQESPRGASAALAQSLGVHPVMVSQWASGLKAMPLDRCSPIEVATDGKVTRRDLRPADWWVHWPELITAEHPAPGPAAPAA